ncbi:MAG: lactonase family protein [Gammaproteobacteria bacterium]|nr:lactonase family protein [Gammaproteobacteria bacterium]
MGSSLAATRFAYVASPYDYTISSYLVDETGLMFPNGMVFTKDKYPSAIIVHPSGKFLYAASRTVDTVPIYKIDPVTGWLEETPESHFDSRLRSPFSYGFHPTGEFLYVAGRGGGVAGFRVNQNTGALNYVPGSPFKSGERTRSLSVHPSGKFVYASNAYTNNISAYRVDQKTGTLAELLRSPFAAGEEGPFDDTYAILPDVAGVNLGGMPYYIASHPSGQFVYVTNWAAASISMFRVDQQNGDLSLIDQPKETGLTPYAVAAHPSGKFVYVSTWGSNDVWGYQVGTMGHLTHIDGSPFATNGLKPVDIVFNEAGTRAFVANISSNNTTIFEVNTETGQLVFKDLAMARAGAIDVELVSMPNAVSIAPKYAFVVDKTQQSLINYEVNPSTGHLKALSRSKTGKDPVAVAQDPRNRFVYVANAGSNNVSAYRIDTAGNLTEIEGSPYATGKNPSQISIDANGWYIYVLNKDTEDLSIFLIHAKTGQLAEAQDSPLKLGHQPLSMSLDSHARYTFVNRRGNNSIAVYRYRSAVKPAIFEITAYGSPFIFKDTPTLLTIDPTGRFAMVVNKKTGKASMYYVQVDNGALLSIKENLETVKVGDAPIAAVYHPKGRYIYVLNESSKNITQFSMDRAYGMLKEIAVPLSTRGDPVSLIIDPSGQYLYTINKGENALTQYTISNDNGQLAYTGKINLAFPPVAMAISRQFR